MVAPDSTFASVVPGARRISKSAFLIVRHTATAVAVDRGLSPAMKSLLISALCKAEELIVSGDYIFLFLNLLVPLARKLVLINMD